MEHSAVKAAATCPLGQQNNTCLTAVDLCFLAQAANSAVVNESSRFGQRPRRLCVAAMQAPLRSHAALLLGVHSPNFRGQPCSRHCSLCKQGALSCMVHRAAAARGKFSLTSRHPFQFRPLTVAKQSWVATHAAVSTGFTTRRG